MKKKWKGMVCILIVLALIFPINVTSWNNRDKIDAGFLINSSQQQDNTIYLCTVMNEPPPKLDPEKRSPKPTIGNPPSEFSWKDHEGKDWTTLAKNQGNCGSCWDFAAVGSLESVINIEEGVSTLDPDFSEQYVLSCLPAAGSCSGGSAYWTFHYIKDTSANGNYRNGIIPESCFPYEANDKVPCSDKCKDWENMLITIKDYGYWEPDGSSSDRDRIKTQLMEKGSLVTFMMATDDFIEWGINNHNPEDYYPYPGPVDQINHLVSLVGWKDDPSISNGGYWILKNSWGSWWGYDGFFNIEYGSLHIDDYGIVWVEYDASSVDWPPIADGGGPYYGDVGQQIKFDGSRSCDPEGDIVSYYWDFGDGSSGSGMNPTHTYAQRGLYTVQLTVTDDEGKHSVDESAVFIDLWKIGESWTFDLKEISINIENIWGFTSLQGSLKSDDLCFEVVDGGTDSYILDFNGHLKGEFKVTLVQPSINISGKLRFTSIDGSIFCRQSDLGIEKVDVKIRGIARTLIEPIPIPLPIPFTIVVTVTFDPAYTLIDFPLSIGKEWNIPSSDISVDASISILFGIIKMPFQYDFSLGAVTTRCTGKENISVEAGTYEAYKISSLDLIEWYYAPKVNNVIKISASFEEYFSLYGELKSANYGEQEVWYQF